MAERPENLQPGGEPAPVARPVFGIPPAETAGPSMAAPSPIEPAVGVGPEMSGVTPVFPPAWTPPPPRPPTVMGVVGVVVLALGAGVMLTGVLGVAIGVGAGIRAGLQGNTIHQSALETIVQSPTVITACLLCTQAGLFAVLLGVLARQPEPWREQVGWRSPGLSGAGYVRVVLATLLCGVIGAVAAQPLALVTQRGAAVSAMPGAPAAISAAAAQRTVRLFGVDAQKLRKDATPGEFLAFLLVIALVPGFVEELLLRGYAQRRLLRRLTPVGAIACSSVLFAVVHLDPVQVIFALPVGIWFGIVAWRTGSIWPGIVSHMSLNALWNIWFRLIAKGDIPAEIGGIILLGVAAVGVVAMVLSIRELWQRVPPVPAGANALLESTVPGNFPVR